MTTKTRAEIIESTLADFLKIRNNIAAWAPGHGVVIASVDNAITTLTANESNIIKVTHTAQPHVFADLDGQHVVDRWNANHADVIRVQIMTPEEWKAATLAVYDDQIAQLDDLRAATNP